MRICLNGFTRSEGAHDSEGRATANRAEIGPAETAARGITLDQRDQDLANAQELQDDFDETGTMIFHRAGELGREFLNRRCAARLHAHAGRKLDPIKFRIVQIEH